MFILVPSLYRSIALRFKIDKYLDKIIEKTDISLDPLRVLGQELCQKNDHFLLGHLKKLIFWNFLTPMLGTFCLLMILHINLYLMIRVVLYFWNCLRVRIAMGITYFPSFFLTWSCFTRLGLMFRFTLNIILLGLLEA